MSDSRISSLPLLIHFSLISPFLVRRSYNTMLFIFCFIFTNALTPRIFSGATIFAACVFEEHNVFGSFSANQCSQCFSLYILFHRRPPPLPRCALRYTLFLIIILSLRPTQKLSSYPEQCAARGACLHGCRGV